MSKRSGARKFGNPAKRRPVAGDLAKLVQPTGVADPRRLGGNMAGPGGPRDHGATLLDTTDAVHLHQVNVAVVDAVRKGELSEQVMFMTLGGRVNKKTDQVKVGFLFGPDGAAALITELLALADRSGAELLDDLTRRLTALHQGQNVDLHFLRAAIDNAIEAGDS